MSRNEVQEPRNRSNSLSAAWSFLFRGQGSKQQQHHSQHSSQSSSPKHQTIREEEDDDEDKAWGKGVTRKVLPQQRRSTSSVHSSPNASSRTSPTLNPKRMSDVPRHPSALERIAIHNGNINSVLASTHDHNISLPPLNKVNDRRDKIYYDRASLVSEEDRQHNNSASHVHHPPSGQSTFVDQEGKPALSSTRSGDHSGFLAKEAKDGCGSESADSFANSTADAHRSSSPASTSSIPSSSCPSPPSGTRFHLHFSSPSAQAKKKKREGETNTRGLCFCSVFRLVPVCYHAAHFPPFFPLPSLSYMQEGHPRHPCTRLTKKKRKIEEDKEKSHIHTSTYTQHPPRPPLFVPILTLGPILIRRKAFVSSYHPCFYFRPTGSNRRQLVFHL